MSYSTNKIPKEQRLGYEYRNYHHYAAIILELGTVGKILVTAGSKFTFLSYRLLHSWTWISSTAGMLSFIVETAVELDGSK